MPSIPAVIPIANPDGSFSSENTITVEVDELNNGKPTLIPSLVAGKQLSDDEAIRLAIRSGLRYPSFNTIEEAGAFAAKRSHAGGATAHGFLGEPKTSKALQAKNKYDWGLTLAPPEQDKYEWGRSLLADPSALEASKNAAHAFVRSFLGGVGAIPQGIAIAANELEELAARFGLPVDADKEIQEYVTHQWGEAIKKFADRHFAQDPRFRDAFLAETLPSAFGSMGAFLVGGVAAKALKGAQLPTVIGMGAAMEGAGQYEEAKAAGASEEEAQKAARWGALIGTSEAWPVNRILNRFDKASGGLFQKGLGEFLKKGAYGAVEEGIQEFFQTTAGNKIARDIYDKERKLLDHTLEATSAGGIVGFTMNVIATAAGARRGRRAARMAEEAIVEDVVTNADAFAAGYPDEAKAFAVTEGPVSRRDEAWQRVRPLLPPGASKMSQEQRTAFRDGVRAALAPAEEKISPPQEAPPVATAELPLPAAPAPIVEEEAPSVPEEDLAELERAVAEAPKPQPEGPVTVVPFKEPEFGPTAGVVSLGDVAQDVRKGATRTKAFFKRFFTTKGQLPKPAFDAKIRSDGRVNSLLRQVTYTLRDFGVAAKEAYGGRKRMELQEVQQVDAVLKGEATPETIPEEMRGVVARMRAEIDVLSSVLLELGVVEGDLAATVRENMGVYAHRAYRVFDDPKWADSVPVEIRNKAKALLRSEYPEASEDEIARLINALLYEGKAADSPIALLKKAKLGAKDLSILTRRKAIPLEIRALWGEYKDARANYARSITKMAHLIANHQMLVEIRKVGLGRFLYDPDQPDLTPPNLPEFKARIAADVSDTMYPLNGLYVTPEVKAAFERATSTANTPDWLRLYMKVNGTVKFAKTVGSLMTHIRNVLGNTGFAVANSHWRFWKMGEGTKAIAANIGVTNSPEYRAYFRRLLELGVVHESARAGELQDVLRDATEMSPDEFVEQSMASLPKRVARATAKGAVELYRAEDDVWKVYAFENERARYRKALPEATDEEIDRMAAEIVRNTYPTYSLVPEGVRWMRRFPLVGTFVSFPAEVIRTAYNTVELAAREMADPRLRVIGLQRATGALAAAAGTSVIAAASRALMGVTRQEDEDKRHFVAPWTENSQLFHLGPALDGKNRFIDLSYTDPYEYLKKPVIALLRRENWREATMASALEAFDPFLGEEILAGKMADVWRNTKKNGSKIYNPESTGERIAIDVVSHVFEALIPGTIASARRIYAGLTGYVTPYGRSYDPLLESLAVFTGHRIQELDIPQSMTFKVYEFKDALSNATRTISSSARRKGIVSPDELAARYVESETSRRRVYDRMRERVLAAQRLGMSYNEIVSTLRDGGISKELVYQLMTGEFHEHSYLSDRIYAATSPSAKAEQEQQFIRTFQAAGLPPDAAKDLLMREYRWRTYRGDKIQLPRPPSYYGRNKKTISAYVKRRYRLTRLLTAEE